MAEPTKRKATRTKASKKVTKKAARKASGASSAEASAGPSAKPGRKQSAGTAGNRKAGGRGESAGGAEDASGAGEPFFGRADQLGAILQKGLDMAEAGLSLGLTVINRVGAAAQEQIFERFSVQPQGPRSAGPPPEPAPPPPPPEPGDTGAPEVPVPEEERYCITNRVPLAPGAAARVSFSINNDSLAEPKRVQLAVEGFVGETGGAVLPGEGFTVKPARKTIAPMDFEKFVLEGPVPEALVPDIYRGSIVVSSGSDFRIPVRLVVLSH